MSEIQALKIFAWGLLFAAVGMIFSSLSRIGAVVGTDNLGEAIANGRLTLGQLLTAALWGTLLGFVFGLFVGIVRSIKRKVNPPPLPK